MYKCTWETSNFSVHIDLFSFNGCLLRKIKDFWSIALGINKNVLAIFLYETWIALRNISIYEYNQCTVYIFPIDKGNFVLLFYYSRKNYHFSLVRSTSRAHIFTSLKLCAKKNSHAKSYVMNRALLSVKIGASY